MIQRVYTFFFAAACLASIANGFTPMTTTTATIPTTNNVLRSRTHLYSEVSTSESTSGTTTTYAQCGRCQSAFPLQAEDLGNGRGRYVQKKIPSPTLFHYGCSDLFFLRIR